MSTDIETKLNMLLNSQPLGVVLTSTWLVKKGYSLDLQKRYRKSRWYKSIGSGALVRAGDKVDYLGGIYALQSQLGCTVHPGGKTALSLQGKVHYLELSPKKATLFAGRQEKLPLWFRKHAWGIKIDYRTSAMLPSSLGLLEIEHKTFTVKVSSPARAIMECLHLSPENQPLMEVYELMEGLNNLRPDVVQLLLEQCASIKVKRLFLYLAEKSGHDWFNYLKLDKVDLGKGKRSIVKNGAYVAKYQITVPKELER
ncbi:MAG: hypothetical protein COA74_09090 [Gammaproteobacteria bacterium]|nr:MAG: hypothetical protein COA74_09090 [Gammaproteobacteria bacterium]